MSLTRTATVSFVKNEYFRSITYMCTENAQLYYVLGPVI